MIKKQKLQNISKVPIKLPNFSARLEYLQEHNMDTYAASEKYFKAINVDLTEFLCFEILYQC